MTGSDATLLLEVIELARQSQSGGLLFEASGALRRTGSSTPVAAGLKFGHGGVVSDELKSLFPAAQDPPAGESALWFVLPPTGAPASGRPAWLGIFRKTQLELYGSVPLGLGAIALPGLDFGADLRLTIEFVLVGKAVQKAHFRVEGSGRLVAALGPLEPAGFHVNRVELDVEVDNLPEIGSIVDDPALLLEAAFRGTLLLDASASGLTLGAVMVGGGNALLRLGVSSRAATRQLELNVVEFHLASPAPLTLLGGSNHLAGLSITQLSLSGCLSGAEWQDLHLQGAGKIALPTAVWSAFDPASGEPGAPLDASFELRRMRDAAGEHTVLEAVVQGLRLTPADALLALLSADLKTVLRSDGGVWSLDVIGVARVGWHELAKGLAAVGAAAIPAALDMPEVHASTKLALGQSGSSGSVSVSISLRKPGAGDVPFAGQLGRLPIHVSNASLILSATFDAQGVGAWAVAGSGRLSTIGPVRKIVPVDEVQFTLDAHGNGLTQPRLRLHASGGLPPLVLPSFNGGTIDFLTLTTLDLELGDALAVSGTVALAKPQPGVLASRLNLPPALAQLTERLGQVLPETGSFLMHVPLDHASTPLSLEIALPAIGSSRFRLLEELGKLVNSRQPGPTPTTRVAGLPVPPDFFEVEPCELRLSAKFDERATVQLGATLACAVFGETFDAILKIGVENGDFEIALMAGMQDPIRITVPMPDPKSMLGTADPQAIANLYGLNATQRLALIQLRQQLDGLADELGPQGTFAFEISDFGLRLRPDGPALSGDVRLIQLPRLLDAVTTPTRLKAGLGGEVDKIFIDIKLEDGSDPLLTIPVPGSVHVDVFVGRFMLAYAWGHNEFAFALDARVVPSRTLDLTAGGSGIYVPASRADVQLGATATAPPVPIPEGHFSFRRPQRLPTDTALDELGLQVVIGNGQTRSVTAYVREIAFSPTYFLIWPGLRADAGLTLNGPNPRALPGADQYLNVRANWDRSAFFTRFSLKRGAVIFLDPGIGFMLNPLAFVPPFLTANPPYWIAPPVIMGDLYADEIGIAVNIPGLLFFDLTFERPLPAFSLQVLLELAALSAGGFSHKIPAGSPLRKLFYTRLSLFMDLRIAGISPAPTPATATVEVNVADFINGAIHLMHKTRKALDASSDLVHEIGHDPALLVRMIPRDNRRLQHEVDIAGLRFSGSVYLLTPQELQDELVLFFENKRLKPRGLAANQTPPDPPAVPPINLGVGSSGFLQITRRLIADPRSTAPAADFLAARSVPVALQQQRLRAEQIDSVRNEQAKNSADAAAVIAAALASLPLDDAAGRKRMLEEIGLGSAIETVEAQIAQLTRVTVPIPRLGIPLTLNPVLGRGAILVDPRTVEARLRAVLAEALARRNDSLVADSRLAAPPEQLAAEIVAGVAARSGPGVPDGPRLSPIGGADVLPGPNRMPGIERSVPALTTTVTQLQRRLANPALDAAARRQALAAAEAEITNTLSITYGVQRGSLSLLDTLKGDVNALTNGILLSARQGWSASEGIASRLVQVDVFAPPHFAAQLGTVPTFVKKPPDPADTVETVDGYEIRGRDNASSPSFSIPLPAAEAPYKVALKGGRYRLYIMQRDGTWRDHDLPAALVQSLPESPDKPTLLRNAIEIVPRVSRRPRTQAEKNAVADQWERSSSLYLTSVLTRPEYQIKAEGGIHGPFFVADLLRNPSTGVYTVPNVPALVAGFKTTLLGSELALAGMIVPGQPKPSAFLYGHSGLDVTVAGLRLKAQGDFCASVGTLWQNMALPSGVTAPQNAVAFSGYVTLMKGADKVLEGSATGEFTRDVAGRTRASLKVHVASQGVTDIGLGEAKFARIAWRFEGNVQVALSELDLHVSVPATASVTVEIATYAVKWVEDLPAQTVCVPWFYSNPDDITKSRLGWKCWTTPAVKHPEIDFTTIVWNALPSANCEVRASVTSAGIYFSLDLTPLGGGVTSQLSVSSVSLPNLL